MKSAALALVAAVVFAGTAFGPGPQPAAEEAIRLTLPPHVPAAPPAPAAPSVPAPPPAPARPVAPAVRTRTPQGTPQGTPEGTPQAGPIEVREVDRPAARQRLGDFDRGHRGEHGRGNGRGDGHRRGRGGR